jgi:formate--tetrahydrofolate ligase
VADGPDLPFHPMYDWSWTVERKVETVAREIYGAQAVDWSPQAKDDLERIYALGYGGLPVCIAKTQKSLSDNPELLGRPKDFLITVREVQIAAGAGFLIPITGEIMRMPGLPRDPAAAHIDIAADGKITGLF